jgi:hypothetical protein
MFCIRKIVLFLFFVTCAGPSPASEMTVKITDTQAWKSCFREVERSGFRYHCIYMPNPDRVELIVQYGFDPIGTWLIEVTN